MRILADARQLPLPAASVTAVISNPPYPGNGVWEDGYGQGLDAALAECRRVLRPDGQGWFLLRDKPGHERWLAFDRSSRRWAHAGRSEPPVRLFRPGVHWGTVPDADIAPLILQCSEPGDVVLDPFAGTGGIPRLAARLGRVPIGADIDMHQLEMGRQY